MAHICRELKLWLTPKSCLPINCLSRALCVEQLTTNPLSRAFQPLLWVSDSRHSVGFP
jgi:hypothetical protein